MENKNPFIENHDTIGVISDHEKVDMTVALSMFATNARNAAYPDRPMYGDEDTIKNTDWAAIAEVINDADSVQLAKWTREFNEYITE